MIIFSKCIPYRDSSWSHDVHCTLGDCESNWSLFTMTKAGWLLRGILYIYISIWNCRFASGVEPLSKRDKTWIHYVKKFQTQNFRGAGLSVQLNKFSSDTARPKHKKLETQILEYFRKILRKFQMVPSKDGPTSFLTLKMVNPPNWFKSDWFQTVSANFQIIAKSTTQLKGAFNWEICCFGPHGSFVFLKGGG